MSPLTLYIHMLELTKLNGQSFLLNVAYIEQVEALPDTTLTLLNGKKIVVKESVDELKEKINQYYKQIGIIGLANKTGGPVDVSK